MGNLSIGSPAKRFSRWGSADCTAAATTGIVSRLRRHKVFQSFCADIGMAAGVLKKTDDPQKNDSGYQATHTIDGYQSNHRFSGDRSWMVRRAIDKKACKNG